MRPTAFMQRFGLAQPIVQAPLAGGGDTPALVAAVCNAGGLGFIGAAYLSPSQIAETARAVRAATTRPFGINLFAPLPSSTSPATPASAVARVAPYYAELGLPAPEAPTSGGSSFAAQFAAVLDSGAAAFSFTFGIPLAGALAAARAKGLYLMGTATTVAEAAALEKAGVDAVVAQGAEAGGHRGTFLGDFETSQIGTMALVPQTVDAVGVPVLASGGIADGRGIAAALALGAQGVQMGTAFLTCDEAGIPDCYKAAILTAAEHQTRVTRAFSGRAARGIVNRFMDEVERGDPAILPFPLQNALTRPLRTAAGKQGRAEFLSLWAGQALRLAQRQSAADLMARLATEIQAASARLNT